MTLLSGNGEFIVRVAVGYDSETNYVFSTFVALAPTAGYVDTKYDLSFAIIEASLDEAHIESRTDGLTTKAVISDRNHRSLIRMVACQSVRHLIDVAKPAVVNMVTHSSDLPEKALQKFHEIAAVFGQNGYKAGRCDPWHGHQIWLMERLDGTQ